MLFQCNIPIKSKPLNGGKITCVIHLSDSQPAQGQFVWFGFGLALCQINHCKLLMPNPFYT